MHRVQTELVYRTIVLLHFWEPKSLEALSAALYISSGEVSPLNFTTVVFFVWTRIRSYKKTGELYSLHTVTYSSGKIYESRHKFRFYLLSLKA